MFCPLCLLLSAKTLPLFYSLNTQQVRYKLDMDEGPERTRLNLRPNRAFYDTYEVLAPAPPSSGASSEHHHPARDSKAQKPAPSSSTAVEMLASDGSEPAAAETTGGSVSLLPAAAAASATTPGEDGEEAGQTVAGSATVDAMAATTTVIASAAAVDMDAAGPMPPVMSRASVEGGNVAAIAALVKTMSASVGVGGRGRSGKKNPLTSVFDLDDTDCSALLELEELRLEDVPEEVRWFLLAYRCDDQGTLYSSGKTDGVLRIMPRMKIEAR